MLSKSSARLFFLGGTAVCTLAFALLTVDTMKQLEARSNHAQLSESALRGYHIYLDNNCMGCHTLIGEGAYYAPELTKVVERRGEAWIRQFLKDPQLMYPGRRKMVKYDFFDPDIDPNAHQNVSDVIAFFDWVSKIDLNDFPPTPDLAGPSSAQASGPDPLADAPPTFAVCSGCHSVKGRGGAAGPALDGISKRMDSDSLALWLKDPQSVKPGTAMPNLGLSDQAIAELVEFLGKQE